MNFTERNAAWGGSHRRFIQSNSRTSAPRVWEIAVEGNRIITRWGQIDGAMQTATEQKQGVNVGRSNEMSAEAYALDRARDYCRKKHWEGYREVDGIGNHLDDLEVAAIDFNDLPLNLSFYKPDNSMGAGITKKAEAGKVWYSRKRNGLMYVLARGDGLPMLYSRRMLRSHDDEQGLYTWDQRFPYILNVANDLLPPRSILLGELVVDREGRDDFKHVQSITKSLTPQSVFDQEMKGRPVFYCWDVAFWAGEDLVSKVPVKDRYAMIHELDGGQIIQPVQFFDASTFPHPDHAKKYAEQCGWEGFVVVDPDGVYGDKAYNFKGKPDRPGAVCAKLKPEFEDDFVAIWDPDGARFPQLENRGERSTKERNNLGIKSVALYQYNNEGSLVYISNVSSGLTDAMKKEMALPDVWPQVWCVVYTDRTYKSQGDDTNALTFARYSFARGDKRPEECVNPEV